jgi:CHAT domain-containing protein
MKEQTVDLAPADRRRLDELRRSIQAQKQAVETAQGTDRADAIQRLVALHGELLALIEAGSRGGGGTAIAAARAVAADGGAVLVPVVTHLGGKIIVVTGGGTIIVDAPELTLVRLSDLLIGKTSGTPGGWIAAYFVNYLDSSERVRRWPEWLAAINDLGPELWGIFGARLDAALKAQGVKPGARLVWLPTGWLALLPLGLTENPATGRRLGDDYEITYAPSLEALASAQGLAAKAAPPTLAAIINPTGDLPGTEKEGAIVASHFAPEARTLLMRQSATPQAVLAALKGRTHWHFASHGAFSWKDARQSSLIMYGRQRLSVGMLLDAVDLGRPRLVVLSACETGLSEITSNPDEFIGLPGTFTSLGAAGVLGTLWPVSDTATALLIAKFYELHIEHRLSPPTALHQAQAWLREASGEEVDAYARGAVAQGRMESRHLAEIEQELGADAAAPPQDRATVQDGARAPATTGTVTREARYAHPYYWAGFILTGL